MNKFIKYTKLSALVITLLVLAGLIALWTPDTSADAMREKYTLSSSAFIENQDGSSIHYVDQGRPDGNPLVFIHGTSASLHTWQPLIRQLEAHSNYRFISLDLPGHGLTGANKQRDYSQQAMIDSVWTVMEHLKVDKASLVGNSLGGAIAWQAALDNPQRVNSLILLAPSGTPAKTKSRSNIGFKILKNPVGQILMRKVAPRSIIESSLRQSVVNDTIVTEQMIDRYWELLRYPGNRQAMIDLAQTERNSASWLGLSELTAPTLIIWGEGDGILPIAMAESFSQTINGLELITLPNIGHLPMEEAVSDVSDAFSQFCRSNRC